MDSTNGGSRHSDGQSSFFSQRGAANDASRTAATASSRNSNGDPEAPKRVEELRVKYEEEKTRIIANCFGKLDERGVAFQNYITHIQVHEYSSSPSEPPPPTISESSKKSRVIIVAVKNSGRVMMHKARENEDKTFQIGKSWPLEELQVIEVFSPSVAKSDADLQRITLAGPLGFSLTLGKPYFWRARVLQEKGHFIQGLIKVYSKYTGTLPQLVGFEPREKESIIRSVQLPHAGAQPHRDQQPAPLQPQARGSPQQLQQQRHTNNSHPPDALRSASIGPANSHGTSSPSPSQKVPPVESQPPLRHRGPSDQFGMPAPPVAAQMGPQPSQDFRVQQGPARPQVSTQGPPIQSTAPLRSQPSRSKLSDHPQEFSRPTYSQQHGRVPSGSGALPRSAVENAIAGTFPASSAQLPGSETTPPLASSTARMWRPDGQNPTINGAISNPALSSLLNYLPTQVTASTPQSSNAQIIPERRRPPMQDSSSLRNESERGTIVPTTARLQQATHASTADLNSQTAHQESGARLAGAYTSPVASPPVNMVQDRPQPTESLQQPGPLNVTQDRPRPTESFQRTSALNVGPSEEPPAIDRRNGNLPIQSSEPVVNEQQAAPTATEEENQREEQKFRPGLGPMMGKKADVANKFRKAATAHSAFKPRAGGAGERLLKSKASEQDAVSKAVPAPNVTRDVQMNEIEIKPEKSVPDPEVNPIPPTIEAIAQSQQSIETEPEAQQSVPDVVAQPLTEEENKTDVPEDLPLQKQTRNSGELRATRRSNAYANSLAAIHINPSMMEGREVDYGDILAEFGWEKNPLQSKQIDVMQTRIRREIGRLEAGSWLGHADQKDDRVELVGRMLDKAIGECDEMERLLTLYTVELSTLNNDIAYIEAQSQGLQVQTANQKLLQNELENLLSTISIDSRKLEALKQAPLQDPKGLADIERSLLLLYQALQKMSPALIGHQDRAVSGGYNDQTLSKMKALQENKDFYGQETQYFLTRLRQYAEPTFGMAFSKTKDALGRSRGAAESSVRLDSAVHDLTRNSLWQYSPVMLFAKEIDAEIWEELMSIYQGQARSVYQDELRDNLAAWKRLVRRPTGEEQDALFTSSQEKEVDGLGSTARKLTVKRSQTLAKTLRSSAVDKRLALDKSHDSKLNPYECFTGALDETAPLVVSEQNFVVDFFHATSSDPTDFVELVTTSQPTERRGTNLLARRPIEPDRLMARKVSDVTEAVFGNWYNDMQNLLDWVTSTDPFQGIGVLCALERKHTDLEDSNQEFILRSIRKLQERLTTSFSRFVDMQIRAIEETKVKINKRRGVINFVKVFPNFSILVENMLPPAGGPEKLVLRKIIDGAYDRISRAIFDSLKTIAKEMPMGHTSGGSADPEDKGTLNYHILLIENMYHFYTEIDERGDEMLGQWRGKAMLEMSEHQELYVSAVIRRPLGKLIDFLEGAENSRSGTSTAVHSRSAFKKVIGSYDSREVRRGIDTLRKRIEKHFSEGDDHAISHKLITQLLGECERRYDDILDRSQRVAGEVYDGSVEVEFGKGDIQQGFRR